MRKHTTTVLLQISSKPPAESSAVVFCHTRIPACLILASSSPYANYFFACRLCVALLFHSSTYSTVSTEIHSIILSMDLHVFACVREPNSRENFGNVQMKIEKITKFGVQFSNFHVFHSSTVYIMYCVPVPEFVMFCAYVCICVSVCVEHSLTLSLFRSAHFCY